MTGGPPCQLPLSSLFPVAIGETLPPRPPRRRGLPVPLLAPWAPVEDKRPPRDPLLLLPLFSPTRRNPSRRSHAVTEPAAAHHRRRSRPPPGKLKPPSAPPRRPRSSGERNRARSPGIVAFVHVFLPSVCRRRARFRSRPASSASDEHLHATRVRWRSFWTSSSPPLSL